ncbi:MAG: RNase adapter RapZ [Arenicellales bacterium WSBS_2016_MAG_OTU3]
MDIVIVSGLSGSGKSIALQSLEDVGYYCIDNLPANLLPAFASWLVQQKTSLAHVAVGIDSRNREFFDTLEDNLTMLEPLGINYQIIFLEANDAVLIKRFNGTRRKHPLTNATTSLVESIKQERELLLPLRNKSAIVFDTGTTTPHELRRLIRDLAGGIHASGTSLLFESFGYKHGAPLDADFVFDVRCLPNPHWDPDLRSLTGLDKPVRDFLKANDKVNKMAEQIRRFIEEWLPDFEAEQRSYITIAIGCTGGQHRSVYIVTRLVEAFEKTRLNVQVRHRELPPPA